MFGQLDDGTLVALFGCHPSNIKYRFGSGIGSPTTLIVSKALFGRTIDDIDRLCVRDYSVEMSFARPLDVAASPIAAHEYTEGERWAGLDMALRKPAPIRGIAAGAWN